MYGPHCTKHRRTRGRGDGAVIPPHLALLWFVWMPDVHLVAFACTRSEAGLSCDCVDGPKYNTTCGQSSQNYVRREEGEPRMYVYGVVQRVVNTCAQVSARRRAKSF